MGPPEGSLNTSFLHTMVEAFLEARKLERDRSGPEPRPKHRKEGVTVYFVLCRFVDFTWRLLCSSFFG